MAGGIKAVIATQFDATGVNKAIKEFNKLSGSIKGIAGSLGIGLGLSAITTALKDSTKAAIDDVKSQALLAQQLRNTVGANEGQIASVEKSIAAMQTQASVADDVIRPAFASLVRATGDVTQATSLTSLALDVAAGTGKDLGAVSLALGKAVNGSTTSLLKLVPSIKGASNPMGELSKQFAGAAEEAANNDPFQRLTIVMGELQEQLGTYLLPTLEEFAGWLSDSSTQDSITWMIDQFGAWTKEMGLAADGVFYLGDQVDSFFKTISGSFESTPFTDFLGWLADRASSALNPLQNLVNILQQFGLLKKDADAIANGPKISKGLTANEKFLLGQSLKVKTDTTTTQAEKAAKAAATKAAAARTAAAKKAAADAKALAKSIADANAEMEKAKAEGIRQAAQATQEAAEAAASAAKEIVDQLQSVSDAAQTEANKYTQALTPLAPTVIEVYQTAVDNLARLQEESQRSLDDMAKGMADVKAQANSAATAFKDLAKTSAPIGAWEQKLNESFANLTASAGSAFNNKLITEDAYKNLKAYAAREKALLTDIAKRRDALAEKISLAKTLYASTKQAIIGFGSITGLLKQQSETITETSTKIIDGIAVTFSKTFEKITSTNLVDEYKKIIDKTKAFAGNLKMLRDQGLNKELFAQIVGAGVDVGGETAAAIAAGGPAVVTELNGLFEELQTIGSQVAETTTVVMYNNGKDVAGGFIEGLISEDQALADAATSIAAIFADTFQIQLTSAMDAVLAAMKAQLQLAIDAAMAALAKAKAELQAAADSANKAAADAAAALAKAKNVAQAAAVEAAGPSKGLYLSQFVAGQNAFMDSQIALGNTPDFSVANGGSFGRSGYTTNSNTINVSVNAGAIANKQELPQMIVDALGTYTRQSGAGGLVRILGIQ